MHEYDKYAQYAKQYAGNVDIHMQHMKVHMQHMSKSIYMTESMFNNNQYDKQYNKKYVEYDKKYEELEYVKKYAQPS